MTGQTLFRQAKMCMVHLRELWNSLEYTSDVRGPLEVPLDPPLMARQLNKTWVNINMLRIMNAAVLI